MKNMGKNWMQKKIGKPHSLIYYNIKFFKKRLVSKPSEKIVIAAF